MGLLEVDLENFGNGEKKATKFLEISTEKLQKMVEPLTPNIEIEYIVRFGWLCNNQVYFEVMDRFQKNKNIYYFDFEQMIENSNETSNLLKLLYKQTANQKNYWLSVDFCTKPIPNNPNLVLFASEKTDFRHLYAKNLKTDEIIRISNFEDQDAAFEVQPGDDSVFISNDGKSVFFVANGSGEQTLKYALYRCSAESILKGSPDVKRMTAIEEDSSNFLVSTDSTLLICNGSTIRNPMSGKLYKLEENFSNVNSWLNLNPSAMDLNPNQITPIPFQFTEPNGDLLYGMLYKPKNFDPSKKYPLYLYVYGGPGVKLVHHGFPGRRDRNHQIISQFGYFAAYIDNRGSNGRGLKFASHLYENLGKNELDDQVATVRYLSEHFEVSKNNIDTDRVAISGWSYGGFMSLYAMCRRNDIFKLGLCGAPPTDWKLYDTAYTERYLLTPQLNKEIYKATTNIMHYADGFPDQPNRVFLFHGLRDENVHVKNTTALIDELINLGKPYSLQVYPSERHGMRTFKSYIHNLAFMVKTLEDYL